MLSTGGLSRRSSATQNRSAQHLPAWAAFQPRRRVGRRRWHLARDVPRPSGRLRMHLQQHAFVRLGEATTAVPASERLESAEGRLREAGRSRRFIIIRRKPRCGSRRGLIGLKASRNVARRPLRRFASRDPGHFVHGASLRAHAAATVRENSNAASRSGVVRIEPRSTSAHCHRARSSAPSSSGPVARVDDERARQQPFPFRRDPVPATRLLRPACDQRAARTAPRRRRQGRGRAESGRRA